MTTNSLFAQGAKIWWAPVDEAIPDPNSVGFGAAWGGNWTYLGDTLTPTDIAADIEEIEVDIQQSKTPDCILTIGENYSLQTTLKEHVAGNYQLVLGGTVTTTAAGASQVGLSELKFGGEATRPEYKWGFEVLYPDANGNQLPFRGFFHRGIPSLNGNITYDNQAANGIPISIRILSDTSLPVGEQAGLIQHVTAPAT